ncbi:MAG: SUMF1/EgtB/PvdO family nonheme iron enzyme [Pirellulaceae bacterium]|nr:SUMF1/EgtB/PvdO family nonheme iron enzyme [Pirellulaceae bacterium]
MSKLQRAKSTKSSKATDSPLVNRYSLLLLSSIVAVVGIIFVATKDKSKGPSESIQPTGIQLTANLPRGFQPTSVNSALPSEPVPPGMIWIPGGEFSMGCDEIGETLCGMPGLTADALPIHRVQVSGFWMDKTEVTNEQFKAFVDATGYVTIAEQKPSKEEFPGVPEDKLVKGSTVFTPTADRVPLDNYLQWWRYVEDADWRHPFGPESNIEGREKFPVVHIACGCRSVLQMVGQASSYRSRMGIRCSRWRSRTTISLGRRTQAERQAFGKYFSGSFSDQRFWRRWLCRDIAGRTVPAQRIRAVRCRRQCLGVV